MVSPPPVSLPEPFSGITRVNSNFHRSSVFIGTVGSSETESPQSKTSFKTKVNKHSMVSKTTILANGSTFTEWVPAMPNEKVQIYRLSNKTLRFGKLKPEPGSSGNYKNKNDFSLVFVPSKGPSSDYKLHVTKNAIDREFMLTHTPRMENPRIQETMCPNCKSCPCAKLALTGCSEQQKLETDLMIRSLRLTKINGRPFFEGNFNFDDKKLALLRSNRNESLKHMQILERKLLAISKNDLFSNIVELFNKKFQKLFATGLCLPLSDPSLAAYSHIPKHYIRWSFAARIDSSSTPLRPITDHSFLTPDGKPEEQLAASEIDKSCMTAEQLNKPKKGKPVSFNQCLLTNVKTRSDLFRSIAVFRVMQLVWLFDIKGFYWHCCLPKSVSVRQCFWWRPAGLGSSDPWVEFCSRNCLFGAAASPPLAELILHQSCLGKIPHVKGCKYNITKYSVLNFSYVDNLMVAKDRGQLFSENLELYDIMQDLVSTISQGSLEVQDHVLCYHPPFEDDTSQETLRVASKKVEKFMESCQSHKTNTSRLVSGHPEFLILGAIARGRISLLEYSGDYQQVRQFIKEQNAQSSAATYWEVAFSKGNINGFHPFQSKFDEYIKPLYDKKSRLTINSTIVVNNQVSNIDLPEESPSVVPTESTSSTTPEPLTPPSTQQLLLQMNKFESLYPKFYLQRHAAHMTRRLDKITKNLQPGLAQDVSECDGKFLSLRYHSITDSFSYKLGVSLSRNIRGVTDGRILSYSELETHLMTKPVTKRQFLSIIQRLAFDPVHLLDGMVVILRLAYRQLLLECPGLLWTDPVDKKFIKSFLVGAKEIYLACNFEIPRTFSPLWFSKDLDSVQPIMLSDAGENSLGFLVYLKHFYTNSQTGKPATFTHLIKTGVKVTPLAFVSSPRKELIAFEHGIGETKHFLHQISPYYQHMRPGIYATDSLSLLQKLSVNSCIFEIFTACRLAKIREYISPADLGTSLCFVHGGRAASQANGADVLTKENMRIHHFASFEYFFGSWVNLDQKDWPVIFQKDLEAPNLRLFSDLLSKYQSCAERLRIPASAVIPSETNVKINLVKYLSYLESSRSILKTTSRSERPQNNTHSHDSNCVLFHSVSDVDCPPDDDLDSLCAQEIPVNWTIPLTDNCTPYSRKGPKTIVKFHNSVDVQEFKSHQAPILIKRFLPLTPQIYQIDLKFCFDMKKSELAPCLFQLSIDNKSFLAPSPKVKLNQFGINVSTIKKSRKPKKIHKRAIKIKNPISVYKPATKLKLKTKEASPMKKFNQFNFQPKPTEFDSLLNRSDNIFGVFSILAKMMKWCKKYKNVHNFMLFQKIERQLLSHCTENVTNYIKLTTLRPDRFVISQDIVIERLRGVSPNVNDLAGRIFLPPQLPFSRCLQRTVHAMYCGASPRFQKGILLQLGFHVNNSEKYFEFISNKKCLTCIRRRAQRQRNQIAPIPKHICVYNRAYSTVSVDCSYHYYYRDKKFKTAVVFTHFLCLQSSHSVTFIQKSTKAQDFLDSIFRLIGYIGHTPEMILCDQGPEMKAVSKQVHLADEAQALHELGETRSATKKSAEFDRFIMQFTNKEKHSLINHLGKLSCLLLFHPSNTSFQSPAESLIQNFRRFWERAGYHRLNCDLFQLNTLVSLTDMSLNRRPLFLLRNKDNDILELCAQDLFSGRDRDFPNSKYISTLSPLSPQNVLAQISKMAENANLAFQQLHSERFAKLISFYKDNKSTEYSKVLSRPLQVGDLCLLSRRDDPVLHLCIILELSVPGIDQYSESSEAKVAFLAEKSAGIKDSLDSLRQVWKRKTMRVNVSNLAPIMGHDQLQADLTVLDDFEIPVTAMNRVNDIITNLPNNIKEKFWSKLSNSNLFTAPLSRILLNETSSHPATDPYYLASRNIRAGVVLPPSVSQDSDPPTEIVKRILPPADFLPVKTDPNQSPPSTSGNLPVTQLEANPSSGDQEEIPNTSIEPDPPLDETPPIEELEDDLLDSVLEPLPTDSTNNQSAESSSEPPQSSDHQFADDLAEDLPLVQPHDMASEVEDAVLPDQPNNSPYLSDPLTDEFAP